MEGREVDSGEDIPDMVESPAPFDTRTRFFGKTIPELGFVLAFAAPGIVLGAVLDNYLIAMPFLALSAFAWVYRKGGLPLWAYLGRLIQYHLFEEEEKEGRKSCTDLFDVEQFYGSFYRTGKNTFISLILVEGVSFDHLTREEVKRLLGTYRDYMNNPKLDSRIQILGVPSRAPLQKIAYSPVDGEMEDLNETEKRLAGSLSDHLADIDETTRVYNYYIAFRYRSSSGKPDRYKVKKARRELEDRTRTLGGYLRAMGMRYERLQGKRLVNTLKGLRDHMGGAHGG